MSQQKQAEYTHEYTEADKNALIRIRNQVDTIEAFSLKYFFDRTTPKTLDLKVKFLEETLRHCIDGIKNETDLDCADLLLETCAGGECAPSCGFSAPPEGGHTG